MKKRSVSGVLLLSLVLLSTTILQPVGAAMIGTGDMLSPSANQTDLDVSGLRIQVVDALVEHGVSSSDALVRAGSLTVAELNLIQDRIDSLPAGQGALGVLGIVFLVLLILEIVGVIDIFKRV